MSKTSGWVTLISAAACTLGCLAFAVYLIMAPVSVPVAGDSGGECGRPALVLNDGTAYQSGEYRPDQADFDDACLRLSRERAGFATAAAVAGLLSLLPLGFVTRSMSRRARRDRALAGAAL